jgi:hypothetical protein
LGDRVGYNSSNPNNTPPTNCFWYGVSRRQKSNFELGAPFVGGFSPSTLPQSFLPINTVTTATVADVVGLAANDSRLYIANAYSNTIHVYNLVSTNLVFSTNWSLPRVYRLTLDAAGNVWVIQRGSNQQPPVVLQYNTNGILTGNKITMATNANPVCVACDSTNFLVVADDGPDENIKYYSFTNLAGSPTMVERTLGTNLMSGTGTNIGRAGPARFYGLTGVGVDTNHNVYVSWNYDGAPDGLTVQRILNGNIVDGSRTACQGALQKFDANGNPIWSDYGLNYVDCAAKDPSSDTDFYSCMNHYTMNWSTTPPGSQWSLAGVTFNRFAYPYDPRGEPGKEYQPILRRLNGGRLYMYCCYQDAHVLAVFRFNSTNKGETAIPCGLFCEDATAEPNITNLPSSSESIWHDANGDGIMQASEYSTPSGGVNLGANTYGWYPDAAGNIWETVNGTGNNRGLRRYRLQGFDTNQTPVYSYANMDVYPIPAPFTNASNGGLERVVYDTTNDIMYLGGFTVQYPWLGGAGTFCVVGRYDNWSQYQGTNGPTWLLPLPYNSGNQLDPNCFDVAGAFIFVSSYATCSQISVYRTSDASLVGYLTPNNGLFTTSQTGSVDSYPFGMKAYLLQNGQYLVTVEDDGYIKTIVYQWNANWPAAPTLSVVSKTVNQLTNFQSGVSLGAIQLTLGVAGGSVGANYKLQTSTDLVNWKSLLTTNCASYPVEINVPFETNCTQFYRMAMSP